MASDEAQGWRYPWSGSGLFTGAVAWATHQQAGNLLTESMCQGGGRPIFLAVSVVAVLVTAAAVEIIREQREVRDKAIVLTGGIPDSGRDAIGHFGCGSCHTIPGITGAQGLVGPSLDRMANRVYIAGRLTNTPANLIRWLMDPQSVSPGTAMPQTGLGPDDARNISAYLYTLQ